MKKEQALELGFTELPHFTVTGSIVFDLGRSRQLSLGCIGTPNEVMFIMQKSTANPNIVEDLVCIHNYDYDGFLTIEKLRSILFGVTGKPEFISPLKIYEQ